MMDLDVDSLKFDANGLIPAIVQDATTKRVIMFAWMSSQSLRNSLDLGETVFYSRSRNELWHKGATSGNSQKIVSIQVDCDKDVLLVNVRPNGPACHKGTESCFDEPIVGARA
jgi:phosphoribosyl-ATP pyrophosphohydrolase/phosphoribosyl-AMP cyclohydrolase